MVDFVADGCAEHDNGNQLGGNELIRDYGGGDGLACYRHSRFLEGCGILGFNHAEPDYRNEGGQEDYVRESQNVVPSSPAGDAQLLIEQRPGQPERTQETRNRICQSNPHIHPREPSENVASHSSHRTPREQQADASQNEAIDD